jgi:hypothetical protein
VTTTSRGTVPEDTGNGEAGPAAVARGALAALKLQSGEIGAALAALAFTRCQAMPDELKAVASLQPGLDDELIVEYMVEALDERIGRLPFGAHPAEWPAALACMYLLAAEGPSQIARHVTERVQGLSKWVLRNYAAAEDGTLGHVEDLAEAAGQLLELRDARYSGNCASPLEDPDFERRSYQLRGLPGETPRPVAGLYKAARRESVREALVAQPPSPLPACEKPREIERATPPLPDNAGSSGQEPGRRMPAAAATRASGAVTKEASPRSELWRDCKVTLREEVTVSVKGDAPRLVSVPGRVRFALEVCALNPGKVVNFTRILNGKKEKSSSRAKALRAWFKKVFPTAEAADPLPSRRDGRENYDCLVNVIDPGADPESGSALAWSGSCACPPEPWECKNCNQEVPFCPQCHSQSCDP